MYVSMLLVWIAITAIAVDFGIYLFSHKYRRYGGYIIVVMAYLVLLADLTYSLYLGLCGTDEFPQLLAGTLVVGAFFSIEYTVNTYRHIRQHEQSLSMMLNEHSLEDEIVQLRGQVTKLTEENGRMLESFNAQVDMQREAAERRNARILANEEYEKTLDNESCFGDTREAFQLYTLKAKDYECERGPKFERRLHNVCERICAALNDDDIQVLMHIDGEHSRKAGEFYDAT